MPLTDDQLQDICNRRPGRVILAGAWTNQVLLKVDDRKALELIALDPALDTCQCKEYCEADLAYCDAVMAFIDSHLDKEFDQIV